MFKLIPARYVFHRRSWMLGGMTIRKAHNLVKIAFAYATNAQLRPRAIPCSVLPWFDMVVRFNGDLPCCMYRQGRQRAEVEGRAMLGNLFEQPLAAIWNNGGYRENRRLVSNPTILAGNPQFEDSFCYGCRKITDITPHNAHT